LFPEKNKLEDVYHYQNRTSVVLLDTNVDEILSVKLQDGSYNNSAVLPDVSECS